ncbi:MAG: NAD(P)H-dependent glycerol-3-phosphate dehydrogenase [Acidobacteriota bacterium]
MSGGPQSEAVAAGRSPRPWQVAVIGAGSWGTALALHAHRAGHEVRLWARRAELARRIIESRHNPDYLPGHLLSEQITVTADHHRALAGADLVLSVVPSRYLRSVWSQLAAEFPSAAHLVSATKGLEESTGLRMTEVLQEYMGARAASLAALSGPSFALELAQEHPTAVTLGCTQPEAATEIQARLSHGPLRIYRNADIIGVEHGGALKNIIAVAAGVADGLGFGTNSRAALITRGLKEVTALAAARGAAPTTLMGLAGLGDLVLTCTGPLSRNRRVGVELAQGRSMQKIIGGMRMVAEGVETVRAARGLGRAAGLEMPITEQVYAILYEGKDPRVAIEDLMARQLVEE